MRTLLPDPPPREIEAFLERRRRAGADTHDEAWDGVLHLTPAPSGRHARVNAQLIALLGAPATAAGLTVTDAFNLGDSEEDFRVPDAGLHRGFADAIWYATAALVVEVISPDDETWQKLPFYAAHDVDELLIVDPDTRSVDWLALADGKYGPTERSCLIDLDAAELAAQIDWP